MALNFPTNPQLGDEYTFGSKTWIYTGVAWSAKPVLAVVNSDLLDNHDSSYYQPALVSGTNIKTINGTSLLGSSDITIGVTATFPFYTAAGTLDSIALLVGNYLPFYDYQGASKNIQLTT